MFSVAQAQATRWPVGRRLGLKAIWTRERSESRVSAAARGSWSTVRPAGVASREPGSGSTPVWPRSRATSCAFLRGEGGPR